LILYSDGGVEKHLDSLLHARQQRSKDCKEEEVTWLYDLEWCPVNHEMGQDCFEQNVVKMIVKVAANLAAGSKLTVRIDVEIV
jgi:hypothetical protein